MSPLVSLLFQEPSEVALAEGLHGCRLAWLRGQNEDDKQDEHERKEEIEDDKAAYGRGTTAVVLPCSFVFRGVVLSLSGQLKAG
jgi:hypothetical protein